MTQNLEAFARKHGFVIVVTREERRIFGSKRGVKIELTWSYYLKPPVLARDLRVMRSDGWCCLFTQYGRSRKEARNTLIELIRGRVLAWSNSFDRSCGDDPKVRVPKNLR